VRNYEPISVVTEDGRVVSGVVLEETDEEVTLQLDAQKTVTVAKADVEQRHPGTVSIMPTGLDKQLRPQQLADLVKYLKED
jgi:putative heme-binding domain-containing protein